MDNILNVSNMIQNQYTWVNGLNQMCGSALDLQKRFDEEKIRTLLTLILKSCHDNGMKFGKFSDSILTSPRISYFLSRLEDFKPSDTFGIMTKELNCIGTLFHGSIKVFSSTEITYNESHDDHGYIFVGTFNDDKSWDLEKTILIKVCQLSNNSNY